MMIAAFIASANTHNIPLRLAFVLLYGLHNAEFSKSEIFNVIGIEIKSLTLSALFKGKNTPKMKDVIKVTSSEKSKAGNVRNYQLTQEGHALAKKIWHSCRT